VPLSERGIEGIVPALIGDPKPAMSVGESVRQGLDHG
jgi:hypothetical protein